MPAQATLNHINGVDLEILDNTAKSVGANPEHGKCRFRARNHWVGGTQNRTKVDDFFAAGEEKKHRRPFLLLADEPPMLSGIDDAPNPVEYLLTALAGCVTTSMVAHAAIQGIRLEEVESEVEGDLDIRGFLGLADDVPKGFSNIRVKFRVKAGPENIDKLKHMARMSPVLNTIMRATKVDLQVEPKP